MTTSHQLPLLMHRNRSWKKKIGYNNLKLKKNQWKANKILLFEINYFPRIKKRKWRGKQHKWLQLDSSEIIISFSNGRLWVHYWCYRYATFWYFKKSWEHWRYFNVGSKWLTCKAQQFTPNQTPSWKYSNCIEKCQRIWYNALETIHPVSGAKNMMTASSVKE